MAIRKCGGCGAPLSVGTSVCEFCSVENIEKPTDLNEIVDVKLTAHGPKLIHVIKTIRKITHLGLKESKDLTDTVPSYIKKNISRSDADIIVSMLEEPGASVELENSINKSIVYSSPERIQSVSEKKDKIWSPVGCLLIIIFLLLFIGFFIYQFI